MAHHHHQHRVRDTSNDRKNLLMRVLSSLVGLTFGFAGGKFFAQPLRLSEIETSSGNVRVESSAAPALGAPLEERMVAASLMDEDGLKGVLAAVHDDWVRGGSRAAEAPRALLQLRMIFSRWTDLHSDNALRAALAVKDASLGDLALEAVMLEWSLRDTLAASQNITLIPWQAAQRRAVGALIRAA